MVAAIKRGDPIPEKLANPPQLNEVEDSIYRIFLRLSSCRLYTSAGVGPIPYDKAYALLEQRGLLELEGFIMSCIDEMDSVFMKHVSDKMKKAAGGKG